ncbi:reverse transcriptase domain-containing protein [Tanacetum coccineum]
MGIVEDVVVRVDGFTFLADFVVVNFEPDPRVPIILRRPFLRTAKALIDLYEEKLTLRIGSDELISHLVAVPLFIPMLFLLCSSLVKTSDNLEEFADELTLLKKVVQEENFQVYSNPLFEFDDNFNSSNVNPLFNEKDEDDENENSNISNSYEPVFLNTPLTDKVECSNPEVDIDEIDAFLAMEVSSNFKEGYYDSEGDSPENFPASPIPVKDSDPVQEEIDIFLVLDDLIPPGVENDDSEDEDNSTFLPDHELPNLDHQDNPSAPRPPPEPPDVKILLEPDTAVINNFDVLNKDACFNLEGVQVRIKQKSQENGQKRTNTNIGTEEHAKSREKAIKSQEWSTHGQLSQPT